jgi:predicted Zn-dependent protease
MRHSIYFRLVQGFTSLLIILAPVWLWGQESGNSPAPDRGDPPAVITPEKQLLAEPARITPALANAREKLEPPARALSFKFTKVDLELLRQVDAFDKYMEEKGWVYNDSGTDAYLKNLGLALAPKQTPEYVTWRFHAIRDLEVNAFALPNGSIYVNSGLISRMENEAQLAGVLAHEITHVVNRHSYLEYRSARKKMVAIDVILAAASAASYAGVSPAIVNAMGNLLPMILVSTMFGYSRELEHEADVYAVNDLYLHSYDLREFSRSFELLRKGPEVDLSKEPVFWASHPKLADRVQYVAAMAMQLQPKGDALLVNQPEYRSATVNVIRHNAGLANMLGQPRTAVAIAPRLIAEEPNNPENFVLLGDSYRTLGARTFVPDDGELSDHGKNEARKRLRKMTLIEYDRAILAGPHGSENWTANAGRAEEAFRKALEMDPRNASAHRGLGFLFERQDTRTEANEQFKKYLELAPNAKDARQIRMHIESMEKSPPENMQSAQPAQLN